MTAMPTHTPPELPPIEYWPSAAVRVAHSGLTWEPIETDDADGVECLLLQVFGPHETLIDVVAWEMGAPTRWWLRYGTAAHLGEAAIALANSERKPVELVGTPREWLSRNGRAVCVLDWSADLATIEEKSESGFVCSDQRLAAQFKDAIAHQRRDNVRIEVVL
jgi:hypothetical protein